MMMRTPFQSRPPQYGKIGAVAIGLLLTVFILFAVGPTVRDVVASLLSAVPHEYSVLPRSVLISRLTAAEEELTRTRYQSLLYQDALTRIQSLETQLRLTPTTAYTAARVLAAPPRTHYDTLLIDKGSADGVREGDTALVESFALGAVTQISEHSSLVELYSSPGATRDAEIGTEKGIMVVRGAGGGALESLVPGEVVVEVGDVVRDTRTGLVLGVVVAVTKRETDTEQYVSIALPVSLASLRVVSLQHAP